MINALKTFNDADLTFCARCPSLSVLNSSIAHWSNSIYRVPKLEKRKDVVERNLAPSLFYSFINWKFFAFPLYVCSTKYAFVALLKATFFKFSKTLVYLNPVVAGLSLGITNALKIFNDADLTLCVSQTQMSYLSNVHGGLYRWRGNSFPFFYIRK